MGNEMEGPTLHSPLQDCGHDLVFTLLRTLEVWLVFGIGNRKLVRWDHMSVITDCCFYVALKNYSSVMIRPMAGSWWIWSSPLLWTFLQWEWEPERKLGSTETSLIVAELLVEPVLWGTRGRRLPLPTQWAGPRLPGTCARNSQTSRSCKNPALT